MEHTTALIQSVSIDNLLQQRNALIDRYHSIRALYVESKTLADHAHLRMPRLIVNTSHGCELDGEKDYIKTIDASAWSYLMQESGMLGLMDTTAKQEWGKKISEHDVPELTLENIEATFQDLHANRGDMFHRGVIKLFQQLSWNYKTNSPFKMGKKIIVEYVIEKGWSKGFRLSYANESKISDLDRVLHILDGKCEPEYRHSAHVRINTAFQAGGDTVKEIYFDLKAYKNGNAHITFTRMDLIEKMNKIIGSHFPFHIPQDHAA